MEVGGLRLACLDLLIWDLGVEGPRGGAMTIPGTIPGDNPNVDHVFYFTTRDSINFGYQEYFGLVPSCEENHCKLCLDRDCAADPSSTSLLEIKQ